MDKRIAAIKAKTEAGRPIKTIDVKYLIDYITKQDVLVEVLSESKNVLEESLINSEMNLTRLNDEILGLEVSETEQEHDE